MKTTQLPLTFFFLAVAFCICMVISNILAVKQFDILGWPSTAGLILFPFTYIINDCVAEIWGYKKIRLLIWTAFFSTLPSV